MRTAYLVFECCLCWCMKTTLKELCVQEMKVVTGRFNDKENNYRVRLISTSLHAEHQSSTRLFLIRSTSLPLNTNC